MPVESSFVTREDIVRAVWDAAEPLSYVRAFWENGAISFGRRDRFSDVDANLFVDEGTEAKTFEAVEKAVLSLSPISLRYVPKNPDPGTFQTYYRLERADEFHILDLAIFTPKCPDLFLDPERNGKAVFHFNKEGAVKVTHLDEAAFSKEVADAFERCRVRFEMFNNFVEKEIGRGNPLEAMDYYYSITLSILLTLLRIRLNPHHYDFRMRYVYHELPKRELDRLERLYFVKDVDDLKVKFSEATAWARELIASVGE
jgi:hypothetical protein